jgi:hypothetical protein
VPRIRLPADLIRWESPVSVDVLDSAGAVRAALEEMGVEFERKKSTRLYSKFSVVMMVPKGAYVFQFSLKGDTKIIVETWQTAPSSSSDMTWLRVENFRMDEEEFVRRFLTLYRKAAGKDPWAFTFAERARAGAMLPEWRRARKAWASFGFDTARARRRAKRGPEG